jgi:hypothetical protein
MALSGEALIAVKGASRWMVGIDGKWKIHKRKTEDSEEKDSGA